MCCGGIRGEYIAFSIRRTLIWANGDDKKETQNIKGKPWSSLSSLSSTNKHFLCFVPHKNQPQIIHAVDIVPTHTSHTLSPRCSYYVSLQLTEYQRLCYSHIHTIAALVPCSSLAYSRSSLSRSRAFFEAKAPRYIAFVCAGHAHRPIGCLYFRPYFSDCPIIVSATLACFHLVSLQFAVDSFIFMFFSSFVR